jgi:biotin operon repressor
MLDVALALVNAGWAVLPCGQDKAPLIRSGFKARSVAPETIRQWWLTYPDALPAIVPGDGNLAALDVDSTAAATAVDGAGYLDEHKGFVVATGGTSASFSYLERTWHPMHIYVRATEQPNLPRVVARFRSGYVIAPGARRGERVYRVSSSHEPAAWTGDTETTPVAKTTAAVQPHDQAPDIARVRQAVACIPNDGKDREAYVGRAHMIRGAVGEDGKDIFLEWAARWKDGPVDPVEDERVWDTLPPSRLGWDELWHVASSHGFDATPEIQESAQTDFPADVAIQQPNPLDDLASVRELLAAIRDAQDVAGRVLAVAKVRHRFHLTSLEIERAVASLAIPGAADSEIGHSLGELMLRPELLTAPSPAIPHLAWSGLKTLLSAREKTGKSTLALAGAAAATNGAPFLDERVPPQTVLWVTEEPLIVVVQRALEMKADPSRFIVLPMRLNPAEQLKRAVDHWSPQIIVIDTLYRYAGVEDENDAAGWLPVFAHFDEITRTGAALLLVVHATKASKGGEYRGSSAIGGHVDLILAMSAPDAGTGRKVRAVGRLPLSDFDVRLAQDRTTFELLGRKDPDAETVRDVRALLSAAKSPETRSRLRRNLNVGQAKVDRALRQLMEEGAIVQDRGGYRLVTAPEDFGSATAALDDSQPSSAQAGAA